MIECISLTFTSAIEAQETLEELEDIALGRIPDGMLIDRVGRNLRIRVRPHSEASEAMMAYFNSFMRGAHEALEEEHNGGLHLSESED